MVYASQSLAFSVPSKVKGGRLLPQDHNLTIPLEVALTNNSPVSE